MPEIKDSPPHQSESLKPKIERFLKITNACISGEISPIDAFRQIVDYSPHKQEPIVIKSSSQNEDAQQETDKKIVQIREQLSSLEIKPEIETILPSEKRCLFPPKKSLLEEHSKDFKKEKHTAIAMVHYLQDIIELKKLGIPKAKKYYDAMRARGFEYSVIESAKSLTADGVDLSKVPKAIDRLYMIGIEGYCYLGSSFFQEIKDISTVNDQQFQKNFEQLNKYSFLESAKGSYRSDFIEVLKNGIPPESELFIDHIEQLCSNIPIDHLKDIVNSYSGLNLIKPNSNINDFVYNLDDIYQKYCKSEFNSNEPLSIPKDILSKITKSYYSDRLKKIDNLHNRDYQKFFLNQRYNSDYLFNNNHTAKSEFYLNYYSSSFNTEKTLNLPQDILSTFDEQDQKIWQGILNIKDIEYQKFFLDYFKDHSTQKSLNIKLFNNDHQPTSLFFDTCIGLSGENNFFKSTLTPELIQTFSLEDQKFWNCFLNINYLDRNLHYFINKNKTNLDRLFNENNQPNSTFFIEYITYNQTNGNFNVNNFLQIALTPEIIDTFIPEDQNFWNALINLKSDDHEINNFIVKNKNRFDEFFNDKGQPTSRFFEQFIKDSSFFYKDNSILKLLTPETLQSFIPEDQKFWNALINLKSDDIQINQFIINNKNRFDEFFNDKGQPTSRFFEQFIKNDSSFSEGSSLRKLLIPETLQSFSPEDQRIWNALINLKSDDIQINKFIINNKNNSSKFFNENNQLTKTFFDSFRQENLSYYNYFFGYNASKNDWQIAFGKETIDRLLDSLPTSTFEKRNAFTHNEYDRTSKFFNFLINNSESNFVLDKENLLIATDYIKTFGLSSSPIIFRYFKSITEFNQGKIDSLPQECIDSGIKTINELKDQINYVKKQCLSSKPFENLNLSPLQLNFLSVATGHSSNTFTRIPIEKIIQDFSEDLSKGEIVPLSPEFFSRSTQIDEIQTKNTVDLSKNKEFQIVSNEVLASIKNIDTIDDLKIITTEILQSKIVDLSKQENNDFLNKQIKIFKSGVESVGNSSSIDDMVKVLVSLNINFGKDQEKYNSVLRQLVFRKVLKKHNGSNYTERLKDGLENNPGVTAISENLNFLNNLVKDHALNFQTNEEGYWQKDSFTDIKKYEKVLKKNLGISSLTKELESISRQFEIIKSNTTLDIEMIPDRGITGELAGYMANVCYTRVYPLLKTYPNVVPYKFIASPESDNPQIIGSTLVFKIETADNEPVLLIRAFNIPDESSLDIGSFFEKFVDSLSQTAKELGIKKIITAGTIHTVSNYPMTKDYIFPKYITGKTNVTLKEEFKFNDYDDTNDCYLVRDLSH